MKKIVTIIAMTLLCTVALAQKESIEKRNIKIYQYQSFHWFDVAHSNKFNFRISSDHFSMALTNVSCTNYSKSYFLF